MPVLKIDKAFILAAGYGTRMRPLTETVPKPLVEVGGQSLLVRTLDQLEAAGVAEVVINTHYLAEKITEALAGRASPRIHFSHEEELLDTGGGIKAALDVFGDEAFYVLSGDGLWQDPPSPGSSPGFGAASPPGSAALTQLARGWDDEKMDILMLLQPVETMKLTRGVGDYDLEADGRAVRRIDKSGAHMFTSIRINHPRIFEAAPEGAFSYLALMDKAQEQNRLYGMVNRGDWHHISTPADLAAVEQAWAEEEE